MNPALIAAINFALSSSTRNKNQINNEDIKIDISNLSKKINTWYKSVSGEELEDVKKYGIVPQDIEDILYKLNTKYNIKFNLENGKWSFPKKTNENMSSKLTDILTDILKEEKKLTKEETSLDKFTTKDYDITDDVGKFFVVTKPTKDSTKDDILFECDIFGFANQIRGGLKFEDVRGIYKNKSDAGREATQLIKNFETELNELENQMEEFRKSKSELNDKKKAAVDRIKKMKGE